MINYTTMSHRRHQHKINGKKLIATIFLNFIIAAVEVAGGLLSNSLSLLSDSLHNFSDAVAVLISFIALKLSKKETNFKKTFGFKRIEILAALFNAAVLIIISFFLFEKAIGRLTNPETINSGLMIGVAIIGLMANALAVLLLRKDSKENINIKSAYFHLLADTLSSVAVLVGGTFIYLFKIYWMDPIITIFIGLYVLKGSFSILMQTIDILMQAVPKEIDILEIQDELEKLPRITNLHHVHVWQLSDKDIFFEGHIELNKDVGLNELDNIRREAQSILQEKFGIGHVTIQMESEACDKTRSITCNNC